MPKNSFKIGIFLVSSLLVLAAARLQPKDMTYGSPALDQLVQDSYHETNGSGKSAQAFYGWLEKAYQNSTLNTGLELKAELSQRSGQLGRLSGQPKVQFELAQMAWTHKLMKEILPIFSLQRGFEFRYAAEKGERQCLLQSILMASWLQKMGIDAGLVMVFKNPEGQESNNGHCVVLANLSNGHQVLVDASHAQPLVTHKGLMLSTDRGYRFVYPNFNKSQEIVGYDLGGRDDSLATAKANPLDLAFIRSQYYFYRGERVPGGIVEGPRSQEGLARSEHYLQQAVGYCPNNQLAVYFLGRVQETLGKSDQAHRNLLQAHLLYKEAGWAPSSVAQALQRTMPQRAN